MLVFFECERLDSGCLITYSWVARVPRIAAAVALHKSVYFPAAAATERETPGIDLSIVSRLHRGTAGVETRLNGKEMFN